MGTRSRATLLAGGMLCCAACAPVSSTLTSPTPASIASTPASSVAPYAEAPASESALAEQFVRAAVQYDSARGSVTSFLAHTAVMTAPWLQAGLRKSARGQLDWAALRDRHERVRIDVNGVTEAADGSMIVELERITSTDFATVRDFDRVRIDILRMSGELRVAGAWGAGL